MGSRVQATEAEDTIVMQMGEQKVTAAQLKTLLEQFPDGAKVKLLTDDNFVRIFAVDWFRRYLYAKAAQEEGILKQPGLAEMLADRQRDVISKLYVSEVVEKLSAPTDNELNQYYEMHKATVCQAPDRLKLSRIIVGVAPNASAMEQQGAKERVEGVRQRIGKGEAFGTVADQTSDVRESMGQGELGWQPISEFRPLGDEIIGALQKLKKGETTAPIRTKRGFEIYLLEDRQDARILPLEECRSAMTEKINEGFRKDIAGQQANELAERYGATMNIDAFFATARTLQMPAIP